MTTSTTSEDILNTEGIANRLDELRHQRDAFDDPSFGRRAADWAAAYPERAAELAELEALLSELAGQGGDHQWEGEWYPSALIHEDHFKTAMDELLKDIGAIPDNLPPYLSITVDYDVLRQDYTEVDIDGHTYLYR